jgi:four helix bundle protein
MAETDLVQRLKVVGNEIYFTAAKWPTFAQIAVGQQLIGCVDSMGANLVEGDGRYSDTDALHFFTIARGSLREAEFRLAIARDRDLFPPDQAAVLLDELSQLGRMLNALIDYRARSRNANKVREEVATYTLQDEREPLAPHASRLTP